MPTLAEMVKNPNIAKNLSSERVNRKRNLRARRYDIVGYRINGVTKNGKKDNRYKDTITEFRNVSARDANSIRAELKKSCYRVDKIEVSSSVRDSDYNLNKLVFTEKNYVPRLEGSVPNSPAMSDNKIKLERNQMHRKNADIMARGNNSTETRSDSGKVMVFDKETGSLVLYGTEEEAAFFILNKKDAFSKYVFYVSEKVFQQLRRIEENV